MDRSDNMAKARAVAKMNREKQKETEELINRAVASGADMDTVTVVRKDSDRSVRKERIPFGVPVQKLQGVSVEGYRLRWINDYPGRIAQAQAGGWEFVESDEVSISAVGALGFQNENLGSKVARIIGKNHDGSPLFAYLMKLPEEFAKENEKIIQGYADRIDDEIRRAGKDVEHGYVPRGHTNVYKRD